MSPLNVHANRSPVTGEVVYVQYHPGEYLVAWHPKSSELNERNTVVIKKKNNLILVRQIAGKVARKIVCYTKPGALTEPRRRIWIYKIRQPGRCIPTRGL